MNGQKPSPRNRRRWWLLLPVLGLLIAGGVIAYRISLGPELHPVAHYQLPLKRGTDCCPLRFSAQGMGYPAIAAVMVKVRGNLEPRSRVLDDLCRPLDVTVSDGNISPAREIISWGTYAGKNGKFDFHFRRRDGRQANVPCPSYGLQDNGPVPYSDRLIGYLYSGKIDRIWLYTPDGLSLPQPHFTRGMTKAYGIASTDDRLIPLTDRKCLFLYDHTVKKIVLATPFAWDQTSMIWQHGERLLLVPHAGNALVYDKLRHTKTITPGAEGWRWCEDGTVWTLTGGKLQVLHWRNGTPKLVQIRTRGKPGTRYGSLAPGLQSIPPFRENTDPDWAAVWGDGKLVASVGNLAPAENVMVRVIVHATEALHIKLDIREARRLTLYRDNHRLGSFLLYTKPKPPPPSPPSSPPPSSGLRRWYSLPWRPPKTDNHEHLAFTKDGKYLSWAIDDGEGVRLFVFEVPEP